MEKKDKRKCPKTTISQNCFCAKNFEQELPNFGIARLDLCSQRKQI